MIAETITPSTLPIRIGCLSGCSTIARTETVPRVVASSAASPAGMKMSHCIITIGTTSAGLPRMYVATGSPMLLELRYSAPSAPIAASGARRWNHSRLHSTNSAPTVSAATNATTIEGCRSVVSRSRERMLKIRHGVATKKLMRLSTICACEPPTRMRAATYPTAITMPITANPCIASNNPAMPLLNLLMPCDYL